jgi:hypothetical protein
MASTMSVQDMEKLAQKLAKMKFDKAKWTARRMDKQSDIELFRTAVGTNKWITRFALPNKGLLISLVEEKEEFGAASDLGHRLTRFKYVEAIVEAIPENRTNNQ